MKLAATVTIAPWTKWRKTSVCRTRRKDITIGVLQIGYIVEIRYDGPPRWNEYTGSYQPRSPKPFCMWLNGSRNYDDQLAPLIKYLKLTAATS